MFVSIDTDFLYPQIRFYKDNLSTLNYFSINLRQKRNSSDKSLLGVNGRGEVLSFVKLFVIIYGLARSSDES